MSRCEECFYFGRTRFGSVCNFDGTFNPVKKECPNFKSRTEVELEKEASLTISKLFTSLINSLIDVSPEIEKLEDEELRNKLLAITVAAKQIKSLLT